MATAKFETLEFDVDGVKTVVRAIGQGEPVVYLHGASTLEGFDFAGGLSDRYRVYCPSHPGMGHSGDAPHVADMSDMLVHYLNLLDALDFDTRPHLIGFSMGGWMATELAAIARERFDKVVLIAPAGLGDPAHPPTDLRSIAPPDFPSFLAHDVGVAMKYFPDGSDANAAEQFATARARENNMVGLLCAAFGMMHPNLRRFLRRIHNPTLVVWGTEDRLLPASQAPLWIEALRNARLLMVAGAGHLVAQERPETLMKIGDFLAD
ncbi:alpha/beta fold hydrolase [Paraburkholderia sp. BCC1886]|uniref:alpha/beta fold hydrolase n=1 Tax=Paraburkholderia sp. BCC1886 TaxID=2562670 RepID=UPI0011838CAF|nr:alpha/beta hydrolase [Paraburkholderia sp. BCC1886]